MEIHLGGAGAKVPHMAPTGRTKPDRRSESPKAPRSFMVFGCFYKFGRSNVGPATLVRPMFMRVELSLNGPYHCSDYDAGLCIHSPPF